MTVEDALNEFFRLLPPWTDPKHKALIAIAFASGAYTAATIGADGDPEEVKEEARAICERLRDAFDAVGELH